jgi:hypothetical protein
MQSHKNSLKKLITDTIEADFPEISDKTKLQIARVVAEKTVEHNAKANESFNNAYQEMILNYESNRSYITDYMNMLKHQSEMLIKIYKEKRFVTIEFDAKKGCNQMKYRTEVLKDTCVFMNKINEMVVKYTLEVMKINSENKTKEQIGLF